MDALTTEGYAGKRQAEHCKDFKVSRFLGFESSQTAGLDVLKTDGWGEWRDGGL